MGEIGTNHYHGKCRFLSGRDRKQELDYRIEFYQVKLDNNLYKAILSFMGKMETGKRKDISKKEAADKYEVSQKSIIDTVERLHIQVERVAETRAKQRWGQNNYFSIRSL